MHSVLALGYLARSPLYSAYRVPLLSQMPLGVAYATWCSVGMVLTTLLGAFCFGEALNGPKVMSILLVVLGVIGLNLAGGGH